MSNIDFPLTNDDSTLVTKVSKHMLSNAFNFQVGSKRYSIYKISETLPGMRMDTEYYALYRDDEPYDGRVIRSIELIAKLVELFKEDKNNVYKEWKY